MSSPFMLPILKPADWQGRASEENLLQPFYLGQIDEVKNPVVAYGVDEGETIRFIHESDLNQSIAQVHSQALEHLKQVLADHPGWQVADIDAGIEGADVIELRDHYYSSEAIFLTSFMQQAHQRLNSDSLIVASPVRGHLYAMSVEAGEQAIQHFAIACIAKYYQANEPPISPTLWRVEKGQVIGFLGGTEDIESYVKEQIAQRQAQEGEQIQIQEATFDEADGKTVHLLFNTEDPELLLNAIQQTSRQVAQEYNDNTDYSGRIIIVIAMTETLKLNRELLIEQLEGMIPFLNNQLQTLQLGPASTTHFELSYKLDEET